MARSTRLTTGMRSAPTTEMYTRCAAPARDAARTRFRALSSSPLGLPARCTMVSTPSTAGWIPSPVARSPVTNSMPLPDSWLRRLSTRTSQPASHRRRTTRLPSVPVPPVTRMGDVVMAPPNMIALLQVSLLNRDGGHTQVSILISLSHRPGFVLCTLRGYDQDEVLRTVRQDGFGPVLAYRKVINLPSLPCLGLVVCPSSHKPPWFFRRSILSSVGKVSSTNIRNRESWRGNAPGQRTSHPPFFAPRHRSRGNTT